MFQLSDAGKLAFSSVCHEGGVVLSVGNLSTQYAWAFVGLSVVEVIRSSITVVIRIPSWMHLLDSEPMLLSYSDKNIGKNTPQKLNVTY